MIADTIMSGRLVSVVMMSAMIAMMFERDIVIPSRAPSVAAGGAQFLVVLGRVPPDTHNSTPMCSSVKWFWVDFLGFLPLSSLGPSPLPPSPPLFVSLVADIGGVGALLAFSACPVLVLTCGYCIKGLQDVSNFVIIKV